MSSNMPFGSPVCLSFEISPPNGFGVVLSTPASLSAALFATAPWPSARPRITGLLGETLSRSQRVGKTGGCQCVSIQPRPVTHSPGFAWSTRALTFARKIFKTSRAFEVESHLTQTDAG